MRVVELRELGEDHLEVARRPEPTPGRGQVVIRLRAVSLNYRDLLMVRGQYDPRLALPLVPLSDGVGEVIEVGDDVTRVSVGDRVAPIFCQRWLGGEPTRERLRSTLGGPLDGTLTERMCVDERSVVPVPEHLSDAEASTLACAGVTAWRALVTHGRLRAGETVLVQGTGGVSLFALQLAKVLGARVIATSSNDAKLERLRQLGADETINYRSDTSWGTTARDLTDRVGVDHVVEVAGGESLAQSLKAIRIGGTISIIGVLGGAQSELSLLPILMQDVRLQGVLVGSRDDFEAMNRAIATAGLRPVVDEVFPFDRFREAFDHVASGAHFGKVSIDLTSI